MNLTMVMYNVRNQLSAKSESACVQKESEYTASQKQTMEKNNRLVSMILKHWKY